MTTDSLRSPQQGASQAAGLKRQLGIKLDTELLELALTHRSWAYEHGQAPHNERLEFLGDAILGQAVTVRLFTGYPQLDEGALAKRRSSVVSTVALARIARDIGLGEYIRLGRGEELTGGRDKDSILADTMEAVIGATFIAAGAEEATALILRLVEPLLEDPRRFGAAGDAKTSLQELASRLGESPPTYSVTSAGPDHDRVFTATVRVGATTATGTGTSKKQAEMAAALDAWNQLSANA